jgi:hypothetical protein
MKRSDTTVSLMPVPGLMEGKTRKELLDIMGSGIEPLSVLSLQADAFLRHKIAEDAEREMRNLGLAIGQAGGEVAKGARLLEQSISNAAAASDGLGRKVFWLNVILAAATVVGAFAALWSAFS